MDKSATVYKVRQADTCIHSQILSRRHALSAVFRALNDHLHTRLKSHNLHSEIVFSLSATNNIGEAFRRFGIGETTRDLLVFQVVDLSLTKASEDEERGRVEGHLIANVRGEDVGFTHQEVAGCTDLARVRKIYKLGGASGGGGGKGSGLGGKKGGNGSAIADGESETRQQQSEVLIDGRAELETQILGLMALRGAT